MPFLHFGDRLGTWVDVYCIFLGLTGFHCLWARSKIQGVPGWRIKMVPGSGFQDDLSWFEGTLIQSCKFHSCIGLCFAQRVHITQSFHTADLLHRIAFRIFWKTQNVIKLVFTQGELAAGRILCKTFWTAWQHRLSIGSLHDNFGVFTGPMAIDSRTHRSGFWTFIWNSRCQFSWFSDWLCDSILVGRINDKEITWIPSAKLIWPVR